MIICLIGTRAQLIKMAPVLKELENNAVAYRLVLTGQHQTTMRELLNEFGIATKPQWLYNGPEVNGLLRMAWWLPITFLRAVTKQRQLFARPANTVGCIVIHGDTFSTLLGALFGRWFRFSVVHVESGLASGCWHDPFPEELTRRAVFRLSDIALCPGSWAMANITHLKLERIDTLHNTIVDAVRIALETASNTPQDLADNDVPENYAIVSIHRFENIFKRARLEFIIDTVEQVAKKIPLVFVLHPATEKRLKALGGSQRWQNNPRIQTRPRMTYLPFQRLVAHSRFVITDGGSNQEELAVLNKPTLLMRNHTERQEGLNHNVVLSHYSPSIIHEFVDQAVSSSTPIQPDLPKQSPSKMIAALLSARFT